MIINKKNIIRLVILVAGVSLVGLYLWTSDVNDGELTTPDVQGTSGVQTSPNITSSPSPKLNVSKVPLPTGTGKTLPAGAGASCQLKGEIKFVNSNTYDNQDALFTYSGIDEPGRNIMWTVSPQDDIQVGPNIFTRIPIPNGESLLGVFLPENPKYKRYELTAKIQYGRVVDGNVKVFEKQCDGKTTVVLP